MTTEINAIFEQIRDRLKQLGNGVADLAQNYADILDSPTIQRNRRSAMVDRRVEGHK